jgi:hypothetical protein
VLQNAVHHVKERRAVKTQADQYKIQNGKELAYEEYVSLLLSAASSYDSQFKPKGNFAERPARRVVYYHGTTESDDAYDIDSTLDVIQANGHSSATARPPGTARPFGTNMPFFMWNQLSQDAKDNWDGMTDEAKAIILDTSRPPGRNPTRPPNRQRNLHDDISVGNTGDVDNFSEARSVTLSTDPMVPDADGTSTTLLAHATKHHKHHDVSPADLYKVLSSTMTRYSKPKPTVEEVVLNGKKYRGI